MNDNPYVPPKAELYIEDLYKFKLASRRSRLLAYFIDAIIEGVLIGALAYFLFDLVSFESISENYFKNLLYLNAIYFLITSLIFITLHGYLLINYGQTIGKRIVGIKIVNSKNEIATFKSNILPRYAIIRLVIFIPYVGKILSITDDLFILGNDKRCFHDVIAKTIVVKN